MNRISIDVGISGNAEQKVKGLSGSFASLGSSIGGMIQVAGGMIIFSTISGLVNGLTNSIKGLIDSSFNLAVNFEKQMKGVQAVLGGTQDDFEALTEKAEKLGASTIWTTNEVAAGVEMLARNGLNATQILDGAIDATLSLATATATDLSTAADIATDAMLQFNFEAADMAKIVDRITGVTTNSKFTIVDYAYALSNVGGSAASLGVEFDEMNTTIALTSSYFSSGMTAGTAYRTFLTRLVPASKEAAAAQKTLGLNFFESSGEIKSMRDITQMLSKAFSKLSDEQKNNYATTLFGTEGMRFALGLAEQGVDTYDRLAESLSQVSAEEQAAIRQEGMAGKLLQIENAVEAAQLEFGQFLSDLLEGSGIMNILADATDQVVIFFTGFGEAVEARMPEITEGFTKLFDQVGETGKAFLDLGDEANDAMGLGEKAGNGFVDILIKLLNKASELITFIGENKDEIKLAFSDGLATAKGFLAILNEVRSTISSIMNSGLLKFGMEFAKLQRQAGAAGAVPGVSIVNMIRAGQGGMNGGYIKGFQTGGFVTGPRMGSGRDNILVKAEEGEAILNKDQQAGVMAKMDSKKNITFNNYYESYVDPEIVASRLGFQYDMI